jgi:hypothetical protein
MKIMSTFIPPYILVKTWLLLASYSNIKASKRHAEKMLIKAFGSIEVAVIFAEENGVIISTS